MKSCPYCAEEIQDAAIVCKHCGREIPAPQPQDPPADGGRVVSHGWLVTAVVSFGLMFVPGTVGGIATLVAIVAMGKSMTAESRIVRYGVAFFLCTFVFGFIRSVLQDDAPARPAAVTATQPAATLPASTPPPQPPKPASKWSGGATAASAMDDTPGVVFSLQAEGPIAIWLKTVTPALVVRCQENRTDAYIRTYSAAQVEYGHTDSASVRVRWDDGTAASQRWMESTNNESIFAPNGVAFTRRLASAERLRVEFTPFNASPVVMDFDVRGFKEHAAQIAKTCGWSL